MDRVFTQTFGVVGAIIEKEGKILLVREGEGSARGLWSHPAGWIDVGEDPAVAAAREVKEETGFDFTPEYLLGVYSLYKTEAGHSTRHGIKLIYLGSIGTEQSELADDVTEVKWYAPEEIYAMGPDVLRDVDIKQMVKDYLSNKKFPLDVVTHTDSAEI